MTTKPLIELEEILLLGTAEALGYEPGCLPDPIIDQLAEYICHYGKNSCIRGATLWIQAARLRPKKQQPKPTTNRTSPVRPSGGRRQAALLVRSQMLGGIYGSPFVRGMIPPTAINEYVNRIQAAYQADRE